MKPSGEGRADRRCRHRIQFCEIGKEINKCRIELDAGDVTEAKDVSRQEVAAAADANRRRAPFVPGA